MGRDRAIDDAGIKELASLVEDGYSNEELAKYFGCTVSTILKYIKIKLPHLKEKRSFYIRDKGKYAKAGWGRDLRIYAVYKNGKMINIGTIDDIAKQRGVQRKSVQYLKTPTHIRRTSDSAARIECIEEDITRAIGSKEKVIKKIIADRNYRKGQVLGYYDEEYREYCICDNSDGECLIDFYESKAEMLKAGYLLERVEDYE